MRLKEANGKWPLNSFMTLGCFLYWRNQNAIKDIIGTIDEIGIWAVDKIKVLNDVKFPEFNNCTVVI